jgi:uracil-DNA glycosylase family 4
VSRCALCPNTHRQVLPDGPEDAQVAVVGEGPGYWENRNGIPFSGPSGQELNLTYLPLAGLTREGVFVTNVLQCRCEANGVDRKPSDELARVCANNHLWAELERVNPRIVVACGATACAQFDDTINLELEHGFPRPASHGDWQGMLVPMYHPAAGLHKGRFMIPQLADWENLGKWMRGKWRVPDSGDVPWAPLDYQLVSGGVERSSLDQFLALDTESDEGRPYSIQWSSKANSGRMLLVADSHALSDFREYVHSRNPLVVMHNVVHDLETLRQLGIHVERFRDTMQELYHLGNLPQGLKAAVYRVFGYRMTSYDEVVTPHSKNVLESWLAEALAVATEMRETTAHPVGPDCPTCGKKHRKDVSVDRPHEAESVLHRVLGKLDTDYDPWKQPWFDKGVEKRRLLGQDWLPALEGCVGRMPRRSIVHAPLDRQVQYAVGDADWTLRLANWLDKERTRIVAEEWAVA